MSRTYRRKGGDTYQLKWFIRDWEFDENGNSVLVQYIKGGKKYNEGLARYHSDGGTSNFKEPGPSWFRNLFTERPQRQYNRRELKKFMQNVEYEPMIINKGHVPYWT